MLDKIQVEFSTGWMAGLVTFGAVQHHLWHPYLILLHVTLNKSIYTSSMLFFLVFITLSDWTATPIAFSLPNILLFQIFGSKS